MAARSFALWTALVCGGNTVPVSQIDRVANGDASDAGSGDHYGCKDHFGPPAHHYVANGGTPFLLSRERIPA